MNPRIPEHDLFIQAKKNILIQQNVQATPFHTLDKLYTLLFLIALVS